MDNFDKIIKEKVEQFEVPYNEAHWAEMESKLNSIRAAKIKNTILGSAAVVSIVAVASYFMFFNNSSVTEKNNAPLITSNSNIEEAYNKNNDETVIGTNDVVEVNITKIEDNNNLNIEKENVIEPSEHIEEAIEEKSKPTPKIETTSAQEIVSSTSAVNREFIVYNNKVCLGEEVSFEALEDNLPVSFTWNFGDGTISHNPKPSHIYKNPGVYTVSLSLLNRQTGEEYKSSVQHDVVTIIAKPDANFTYTEVSIKQDDNKFKYPYTTFEVKNPNKKNSYKWDFGNGKNSTAANPKTIFSGKEKNYTTTLTVENNDGCINSSQVIVFNKNGMDLFAPNAFTPNNKGGNETFIPKALLGWDIPFEMTIIDKSGNLVYKTSDRNEPWNGKKNNSGQLLQKGVYLWQVVTFDAEGIPHRHHGQINLIQ